MTQLTIKNQQDLENAISQNTEFSFEFNGLLFYVERGCEAFYNYDIYPVGTDIEQAKEDFNDDIILDGGMWENEEVEGFFDFMTDNTDYLKNLV